MTQQKTVDALLKARTEIDEQLHRHKSTFTVLFTDVVGSTGYFERNGDTAGLAMIQRHDEITTSVVQQNGGKIIKTIGDSAMAEFADPASAVRAAGKIERQFLKLNQTLPENQRIQIRIGIHSGVGYRKGDDLFGDVVNVAARITKRTAAAQILISRPVYEAISEETDLDCNWFSKVTIDGRTEKEDVFEVAWTDTETYRELREGQKSNAGVPSRYEVLSQIGAGGIGVVYKVRDLETEEIVALKMLKPEIASDSKVQENFRREFCLSRKITHKNVCRFHDFGRFNGFAYASMELIEGESLHSRLNRIGILPVNQAVEIVLQICAGLGEAHSKNIVHRDLKPANIMMDRSGTVKIMDFGVARMVQGDGPPTGMIVGTPEYMAPEQAEMKPASPRTDIYALGLLFYEMLTGTPAFTGDSPVAIALKQIREHPKRPREIVPEISLPVEAVILKCIQKDPAKRFQTVNELGIALKKAARARPTPAWQTAAERVVRRTEFNLRRVLRHGFDVTGDYLKRLRPRAPIKIRKVLAASLVAPVFLGGVITFAMYRSGQSKKANSSSTQASMASAMVPLPIGVRAPIMSQAVDLNSNLKRESSPVTSPEVDSESAEQPAAASLELTPSPAPKARSEKRLKSLNRIEGEKKPSQPSGDVEQSRDTQRSVPLPAANQSEPLPSPSQEEVAVAAPSNPDPAIPPITQQEAQVVEAEAPPAESKPPNLFFEVGSFKEEAWAIAAQEKLIQLGLHAVVVQQDLLWLKSYRVEIGPYADSKSIEPIRETLTSQGFKVHPVK